MRTEHTFHNPCTGEELEELLICFKSTERRTCERLVTVLFNWEKRKNLAKEWGEGLLTLLCRGCKLRRVAHPLVTV